jgi:hypothetical protein
VSDDDAVQELAGQAYDWFTSDTRDNGDHFVMLKHDAPEWLHDLVRQAHQGMFPDDWRYDEIQHACARIHDASDVDSSINDIEPDIYNKARLNWLASHLDRVEYCNDAMREYGLQLDILQIIGMGQVLEREEIHNSVLQSLRDHLEKSDEEDDDDDE